MTSLQNDQIYIKLSFLQDYPIEDGSHLKCNDLFFDFDNNDEFRNANVITVVYNLILDNCKKNIYYFSTTSPRPVDDLIFLYYGKEIGTENTFNDLSPTSKYYTIYVAFKLSGDKKLMEEIELRKALGIGYGRRKSKKDKNKRTNKRTNTKYCNKCKSKKSPNHKHKNTYKNK